MSNIFDTSLLFAYLLGYIGTFTLVVATGLAQANWAKRYRVFTWVPLLTFALMSAPVAFAVTSRLMVFVLHAWIWPAAWVQLPTMPAEPSEIVAYRYPEVIVQTVDGKAFACPKNSDAPCQSFDLSLLPVQTSDRCPNLDLPVPDPPMGARDSRRYAFCGADVNIQVDVVIGQDGRLWIATTYSDWGLALLELAVSLVGAAVAVLATMVAGFRWLNRPFQNALAVTTI